MHLDSDDLLAQIQQDWPGEFAQSRLTLLVERQAAEIARLTAEVERLRGDRENQLGQTRTFVGTAFPPLGDEPPRG